MRSSSVAAVLAGTPVSACRFKPRPFSENLDRASVVFLGRVAAVNSAQASDSDVEIVFDVDRYWKRRVGKSFKIMIDISSCGLRAAVGEKWLILGSGESRIGTGIPSGSVLLQLEDGRDAGNIIPALVGNKLGKGRRPK